MNRDKRTSLVWKIIGIFGIILSGLGLATPAHADTNDDVENFVFSTWNLTYHLSLDDAGTAHAHVTEELVAQFPQTDQNRGIIRSIPTRYQGAPAAPENITVTDQNGSPIPFETEDANGLRNILVGDDSYVHGTQTYVIGYTVANVIHATEEADEFYWDLIPVDRQQPIDNVTANISLDAELRTAHNGQTACYWGTPENSQNCELATGGQHDGDLHVNLQNLQPGSGLTVAIGLDPGTVTQPPERQDNILLDVVPLVLVGVAFVLSTGGALSVFNMIRRHRDDTGSFTPQTGVPKALNPMEAQWLTSRTQDPIVAMILYLAVHGVIHISQNQHLKGSDEQAKPVLELVDPTLVTDPLETTLLKGMFPDLQPGDTFTFPKKSKPFTDAVEKVELDSGQAVLDRGYQLKIRHRPAVIAGWVSLALLVPAAVLLILGATRENTVTTVLSIVLGLLSLALMVLCVISHRVHTQRGAASRQQLGHLRTTIQTSTYTSYTSAHTYDTLLPYAVLFGLREDWSKVLANAYQHHHFVAPLWYPALLSQHTTSMSDSLSTMLSSVSSAAATSSPNAGSTGGGAVGAGGGGGAAGGR